MTSATSESQPMLRRPKTKKVGTCPLGSSPRLRIQNYSTALHPVRPTCDGSGERPREQIVATCTHNLDVDEIAGAKARRVAVGQKDRGINIWRLRRQTTFQHQIV